MATILYKDGVAHRVSPYRVQNHLKAGYTTSPEPVAEVSYEVVCDPERTGQIPDSLVNGGETESTEDFTPESEPDKPAFPTDDKNALEAWAKENLGIDLDKRKGLPKLIAEVEAAILESES